MEIINNKIHFSNLLILYYENFDKNYEVINVSDGSNDLILEVANLFQHCQ